MSHQNGRPNPPGQESRGNTILAVDLTFFTLSTVFVLIRVGTRVGITRNFGWDDAVIVLAQLLTIIGKVFIIEEVANGFGQHMNAVTAGTYTKFLKFNYLNWAQTMLVLAATKISICLFLLRLSTFSRLRHVIYVLIAIILISHIPLFLAYVFQCRSIASNWKLDRPGCISKNAEEIIIILQGVISILIDFTCAACPLVLFRNTNLKMRMKIALSGLMGLGFITAMVCIVRTAFSWQIKAEDLSWVETPNALTRIVEVNLGIILACAPIAKPFGQYVLASISGKDPYGLLSGGKKQPPQDHVRWHSAFRISPPAPTRRLEPRKPRKLPAAAYKMTYHAEERFDPPSIVLPIQRWDSDLRSFYVDDVAQWKDIKISGSRKQRAEDVWTLDDSLERLMRAAVEHNRL